MKREEQIRNYAHNNCINDDIDDTSYSLIIETTKWADKTMIEKVCNWLEDTDDMDSCSHSYALEKFDWLLKNHFDYRGLIPEGLAIDATGLNIY